MFLNEQSGYSEQNGKIFQSLFMLFVVTCGRCDRKRENVLYKSDAAVDPWAVVVNPLVHCVQVVAPGASLYVPVSQIWHSPASASLIK